MLRLDLDVNDQKILCLNHHQYHPQKHLQTLAPEPLSLERMILRCIHNSISFLLPQSRFPLPIHHLTLCFWEYILD